MILPSRNPAERATVLIVDDDPGNVEILARILESTYRVLFTTRGGKAGELAEAQQPDLILLDVIMPDQDGYTVCAEMKENAVTRDIPVIFVTAMGEEQYEAVGFEVGGVDYITKPVNPFLLQARVRTHVELKRQSDFLKTLTTLDGLTGIPNRRRLDEFLNQEWKRAVRQGDSPLSAILLDVDHFKRFNDHYGHQAGDECLRRVAGAVQGTLVRATDLAARYGGEEFACLLPETPAEGARQLAERILGAIRGLGIPHEGSEVTDHVTASLGVATLFPQREGGPEELLEAADRQLYRAKQEGRNRVCPGSAPP